MQGLNLRHATEHDYDHVVALLKQLNPDDPPIDRKTGQKIFSTILENPGLTVLVADMGGQIVSSCYLNIIPNLTRGGREYAVLENVVTDDAHRRKGIGTTLLKYAIAHAFDMGCYKVMLLTGRDEQVHAFYQSCGMEKNGKTAFIARKR